MTSADYANAAAGSVPQNTIIAGIAPFSYVFETMPATERINAIMQHELVHILTSDKAAGADRFFRSLFFGKVTPSEDNPLTMLYGYLTTPRLYVPRWFMEGIAVFMETWLSGGYGRLLGCYDEMVFRTLVNEKSRIYDLVGLESAGTRLDFQVGVNPYLYGTRFFGYLGLRYGPESVIQWVSRGKDSRAYFSSPIQEGVRPAARPGLVGVDRMGKGIPGRQSGNDPFQPAHPVSAMSRPRRWDRYRRRSMMRGGGKYSWGSTTRARWPIWPPSTCKAGPCASCATSRDPALYYVCSLAYDAETGTLFYTTDNNAWRDLRQVQVDSGRTRLLIKDGRIGDLAFNRRDRSLWGIRHYNGISTIVRIEPPYREWKQVYSWPYGKDIYDIAISPDGRLHDGGADRDQRPAVADQDRPGKAFNAKKPPSRPSPISRTARRPISSFPRMGRSLFGSSYYSGRGQHLPLRPGRQKSRDPDQHRDRLFPPRPAGQRLAAGFPLHGRRFPAGRHLQPTAGQAQGQGHHHAGPGDQPAASPGPRLGG